MNAIDYCYKKCLAYLEKQKENSMSAKEVLARAGLKLYKDGNQWCILVGDNIQEGICGFGDTIDEALYQFLMEILEKQKEQKPIKVYRVENEDKQKGLWRKFDGTWEPLFNMLTDGLCRNLPMEDSDLYRAEGKKWFASAPSRETLQKWFSKRDLEELTAAGFTISEFAVTNYKKVSEFEYIFTRDSIINRTYLTVSDIYPEQKPAEWSEEDAITIADLINYFEGDSLECSAEEMVQRIKSLHPQQKQNWNKEDEMYLSQAIETLEHENYLILADKLKSLRPHWKPSEEDLMMLEHIIGQYETGNKNSKVMGYLPRVEELDFLKKVLAKWKNLL